MASTVRPGPADRARNCALTAAPSRRSGLTRALEDDRQFFAPDSVQFGLAHLVQHQGAALAPRLATAAPLLGSDVGKLARLQVSCLSRFRDRCTALRQSGRGFTPRFS